MILTPGMLHATVFSFSTFFDPSLVPQWITWLATTILPLATIVGLVDAMTNQVPFAIKSAMSSTYEWV